MSTISTTCCRLGISSVEYVRLPIPPACGHSSEGSELIFPVPVRACYIGPARQVRPSRPVPSRPVPRQPAHCPYPGWICHGACLRLLFFPPLRVQVTVCECVYMFVCILIKLDITSQSGPVSYSFYGTVLYVIHRGVTFRKHIFGWKCACIQPHLLSPLRRLPAGMSLPRHQLQRSDRRKIWGRKRGIWWIGLSPSTTWVKLVDRRLAQQMETNGDGNPTNREHRG